MRILIADDHEQVRRGIANLLELKGHWQVCGEAKDGKEAMEKVRELLPDLILLDVSMPGTNGLDVARLLRQEVSQARIVIMSHHDPAHLSPRALEAGADACIDKSRLATDLIPAIESIEQALSK
jgi:two-component system, NarL family, invasion response regulator UvrY